MILKGQNLRVMTIDNNKAKCVAMATNCVITLTNNTQDASHKDVVGMAQLPVTVSRTWSVRVDSLDMSDTAALLTAMKSLTPFRLQWDETDTANNQEPLASCSRGGRAYLTDATFTFNDRENSTKSLQFVGIEPLTSSGVTDYLPVAASALTKGQYVRLYLSKSNSVTPAAVIAAAKSLSLHASMQLEVATTKDTDGNFQIQEPTGMSYDISTSALVRGADTISSAVSGLELDDLMDIYDAGSPVKWQVANTTGVNHRTKGSVICSGSAVLTQLTANAPNRQNATYDAQLTGHGPYTVGA